MEHDHSHYPKIWAIKDRKGEVIGHTIQMTKEHAEVDAGNRFSGRWQTVEDTGKVKLPNKCCNKCGDHPCS